MNISEITHKPHLKLRIFATLIDYGIYITFFWCYVRFLGTDDGSGTYVVNGWLAYPLFIMWFIYFPGTEALSGSTPGHDILKLRVVKIDGSKIGFWDAVKRRI